MRKSRKRALRRQRTERWAALLQFWERFYGSPKATALVVSAGVHVVIVLALLTIVLPGRPSQGPTFVVSAPEKDPVEKEQEMRQRREQASRVPVAKAAVPMQQVVSTAAASIALPPMDMPSNELTAASLNPGQFGTGRGRLDFGGGFEGASIGRMFVRAKKLGVILDNSPSMAPFLPELRRGIRQKFRGSVIREVTGCHLGSTRGLEKRTQMTYYDPSAVMHAVKELVEKYEVDAIFWFSDLQDGETEEALDELENLLGIRKSGRTTVKFYVRSLGEKPSRRLAGIIDSSGGEVDVGPTVGDF